MFRQLIAVLILLLTLSSVSISQKTEQKTAKSVLISRIDSILQTKVNLDEIPGAVIEIKKGDQVIYEHSYGYAQKFDYDHKLLNPPEKMTVDHLFDIASLTKVIGTTTSIMLLTDRGLIKVDDPVYRYIKAFDTPEKRKITIRHLLTHTAGLCEW